MTAFQRNQHDNLCHLDSALCILSGADTRQIRNMNIEMLQRHNLARIMIMVTMGGDLQPGCLADRLLTGLGQPQINPYAQKEKEKV